MAHTVLWIDPADPATVSNLLARLNTPDPVMEAAITHAVQLQKRPFGVFIDYLNLIATPSPINDAFTFDMDSDDLIIYSDDPSVVIDALIEMALFMRGFSTLIGVEDGWKVTLAIGAWRGVRRTIKARLGIPQPEGAVLFAALGVDDDKLRLNWPIFEVILKFAGLPEIGVTFPTVDSAREISAVYWRLSALIKGVAEGIDIDDPVAFNQRLLRALDQVEDAILPLIQADDED